MKAYLIVCNDDEPELELKGTGGYVANDVSMFLKVDKYLSGSKTVVLQTVLDKAIKTLKKSNGIR